MEDEWDRIAWLCYCMPRFSRRRYRPEDFNPFRSGKEEGKPARKRDRPKVQKETLSEKEIMHRIDEFKRRVKNARSK